MVCFFNFFYKEHSPRINWCHWSLRGESCKLKGLISSMKSDMEKPFPQMCLHYPHFLKGIGKFLVCSIIGQQSRTKYCACITHISSQRIAFTHAWYPTVMCCLHDSHFLTSIGEFVVCSTNGQQCRTKWCACITHISSQCITFTHTWYPTVICLHHSRFLTIIDEFVVCSTNGQQCRAKWCACITHVSSPWWWAFCNARAVAQRA